MKRQKQLNEIISALLIFIILIQLTGCYSSKPIFTSEIPNFKNEGGIVYSKGSKYFINYAEIKNDTLFCKLSLDQVVGDFVIRIHIYLLPDSSFTTNSNKVMSFSLASIEKVEIRSVDIVKTILLTLGIALVILELFIIAVPSNAKWTISRI